jgi:L-seryl-tRNA(Ser) seleniumtransferase
VSGPAPEVRAALSGLPQVDAVVRAEAAAPIVATYGRGRVVAAVRRVLADARAAVLAGRPAPSAAGVLDRAVQRLEREASGAVRRVINATGVVVHTNLGRAPLSESARAAVQAAAGYASVEYELADGSRGSRTAHVGALAAELCGTDAATVVNNGAAALLLVLAALAGGREVVVSRGELIEIGGSFRLPDVMTMSGVHLVEVGTTNRTHLDDYRRAIRPATGLLLKAHRSNFRQVGFTAEVTGAELAGLGAEHGVPFVYDLGSGLIRDVDPHGPLGPLADEPSVHAAVRDGADLVVFSGDKLLGGPQAGIVAGRTELVEACRRHPLARALRIDKLQRAALESTLTAHLRDAIPLEVPTVASLATDLDRLRRRSEAIATRLSDGSGETAGVEMVELASVVGGGALPGVELPSAGLAMSCDDPDGLAARLRHGRVPVIVRIDHGRVLVDLRTVAAAEDDELADLLAAALT